MVMVCFLVVVIVGVVLVVKGVEVDEEGSGGTGLGREKKFLLENGRGGENFVPAFADAGDVDEEVVGGDEGEDAFGEDYALEGVGGWDFFVC